MQRFQIASLGNDLIILVPICGRLILQIACYYQGFSLSQQCFHCPVVLNQNIKIKLKSCFCCTVSTESDLLLSLMKLQINGSGSSYPIDRPK